MTELGPEVTRLIADLGKAQLNGAPADEHDVRVRVETERLRVQREAKDLFTRETTPPAPPFDHGTLGEILARPPEPPMRVAGLVPWNASTLVSAAKKAGKTTLNLNYARCLFTGQPFLGRFPVVHLDPDATIAYLNYEVSGGQLARWADEVGLPHDRFHTVNLRGRRNPLGHADDRAELAALLAARNTQVLFTDPFARAFPGRDQNSNGEVQAFLVDLDTFTRAEVGASDLVLSAHQGWTGEHTRGASALEDWADAIIYLKRGEGDDENTRYLSAFGRDVEVDEDQLTFDPLTRSLTLTGAGSRATAKQAAKDSDMAVLVVRALREQDGLSVAQLTRVISGWGESTRANTVTRGARYACDAGYLTIVPGGMGRPTGHFLTPKGAQNA